MGRRFRNPANGYIEPATTSLTWLWPLIFGPFYLVWRGYWGHAVISFVGAVLTFGLSNIAYAIAIYYIAPKRYLQHGWIEVGSEPAIEDGNRRPRVTEPYKPLADSSTPKKLPVMVPAWAVVTACLVAFFASMVLFKGIGIRDSANSIPITDAAAKLDSNQAVMQEGPKQNEVAVRDWYFQQAKLISASPQTNFGFAAKWRRPGVFSSPAKWDTSSPVFWAVVPCCRSIRRSHTSISLLHLSHLNSRRPKR